MPSRFYTEVTGEKQGKFKGECIRAGHTGAIECLAFRHEVSSPRDPHTGQATGHRQHHLMTITKEFDSSTPMLFKALVENELLTEVVIKWDRPSASAGKAEHFFTVKLEKAFVASVRPWIPNVLDPTQKEFTNMEDVSLVYSKIIWTHEVAGTESQDDWFNTA